MQSSGKLRLTVIEARLTRDTEMFGKMDPFCKIQYRDQNITTTVQKNAGKLPRWNETFDINVQYQGDDVHLEVLDEDITKNDVVGSSTFKMSSLCVNQGIDTWFDIQYKGKKAG